MSQIKQRPEYIGKIEQFLFALLTFIYILLNPPFIFLIYFDESLRLFLEFVILFYLFSIYFLSNKFSRFILVIVCLILVKAFMGIVNIPSLVARSNKFIITILMVSHIKVHREFLVSFIWIYRIVVITLIFQATLGYISISLFPDIFQLRLLTEGSVYPYYGNYLFGNVIYKGFGVNRIPRMCTYIVEPGVFAAMLGFNFLSADKLFKEKIIRYFFILGTAVAIYTTFSYTGLISVVATYSVIYYLKFITSKKATLIKVFVSLMLAVLFFFIIRAFAATLLYSSFNDRSLRMLAGLRLIQGMNIKTALIGYGIGFLGDFDRGFTAGILNLFVEQGFITFCVIGVLLFRLTKNNIGLIIYIMLVNLAFDFFAWPIFWLIIIIVNKDNIFNRRIDFLRGSLQKNER